MEITACPNCGSKNIGIGTLGDGVIFGLSSWKEVCRNCGYQGASLVFESEEAYQSFLHELNKQKKQPPARTTETSMPEKEHDSEEPIEDQKYTMEPGIGKDSDLICPAKKRYLVELIAALILSLVFFVVLFGSGSLEAQHPLFPQNIISAFLLYLLGSFVGVAIFFFLLIVFFEMIYRCIRRQKK